MGVGKVRVLRQERGWTLDALAERAGMTKSYLSKVERGRNTPSIAVAMKLAAALQVDVGKLFGDSADTTDIEVIHADEHTPESADAPAEGSRYLSLAGRIAGKQMLPFVIYPPTTLARCVFREHAGDEFVVVRAGQVEVSFPDRTAHLVAGDSVYFRGGIPHRFRSVGAKPAELVVVIAAPAES
ncbi:helix-turn-helix domain-containing protein [Saccharothrix australiensis]|uniref:XRE family transcriptional regulator n=1 Tax=Saccharothrix australiensis TaxID=2072 RepID=A0A495W6D1_9PSEU|nr:XRE family transcriptional regulator [Saccharothrix australiensis]RKT55358.1 XRE family transcriptional regulator [Saccharothrix australiensis]